MMDRSTDISDSLRKVLIQPEPKRVDPAPPKITIIQVVFAALGVMAGGAVALMGLVLLFVNVFIGVVTVFAGVGIVIYCRHLYDSLNTRRKNYEKWLDEHGRDKWATYRREVGEFLDEADARRGDRMDKYLGRNSPDAQVEAIKAIKEIELAKMRMPQEERFSDQKANTDIRITELTTQAQVDVARAQADAQRDAAKYTAMGQMGAFEREKELEQFRHEMVAEEAQKEREWKSEEAEKDRDLSIEKMITSFEGKINELKIRMEYEKPDAKSRMAEAMVDLEGQVARLKKISEYEQDEPITFNALFQKFKREA
jgi:hypothetical protein